MLLSFCIIFSVLWFALFCRHEYILAQRQNQNKFEFFFSHEKVCLHSRHIHYTSFMFYLHKTFKMTSSCMAEFLTSGFSALQVITFPWLDIFGRNVSVLLVTFPSRLPT